MTLGTKDASDYKRMDIFVDFSQRQQIPGIAPFWLRNHPVSFQ